MRLKRALIAGLFTFSTITVTFIVHSYRTQLLTNTRNHYEDRNKFNVQYWINADEKAQMFTERQSNSKKFIMTSMQKNPAPENAIVVRLEENNPRIEKPNPIEDNNSSSALYYCNFPSKDDYGSSQEGIPTDKNWILKQVQVVIRHGDRSPMNHKLYKKLDVQADYCNVKPNREPTHPSLQEFVDAMTMGKKELYKLGRTLESDPFPSFYHCGSAMLSQLGVVQHLHNGEILRDAYVKRHNLLSEALKNRTTLTKKVLVSSTARSRTIQSAIAFLYGLIPDFRLHQVYIKYSTSDIFSTKGCQAAQKMAPSIKNIQYKSYQDHREKPAFKKLAKAFNSGDHAGVLIDQFVTGFLCKGFELPCYNNTCAALEDLDVLLEAEGNTMQRISEEATFVNQSMLNLQPLLSKLSAFMFSKTFSENAPDFVLFSGHDTTLKPLIQALGIPEYRWPRLGTRLVFELWYNPEISEHYIRILLNGIDYTMDTRVCKGFERNIEKVCQAQRFRSFVHQDILKHFGAETRHEACAI